MVRTLGSARPARPSFLLLQSTPAPLARAAVRTHSACIADRWYTAV